MGCLQTKILLCAEPEYKSFGHSLWFKHVDNRDTYNSNQSKHAKTVRIGHNTKKHYINKSKFSTLNLEMPFDPVSTTIVSPSTVTSQNSIDLVFSNRSARKNNRKKFKYTPPVLLDKYQPTSSPCINTPKKSNSKKKKKKKYKYDHDSISSNLKTADQNINNDHNKKNLGIKLSMFIRQPRTSLTQRYTREKKLGSGAYGEVFLCRDKQNGSERAVKIIKKNKNTVISADILEEIKLLKQIDHPNIMKLYEFFEDQSNYYVVSEVYTGGELFDCIIKKQRFTEADASHTIKQILSGVCYLHKHNIVHRDLKPENLLFEDVSEDALIKIVDFGLSSTFTPQQKMKDRLGTAYYIAPEVIKQKYDEKCDVWSCGVILYILLYGYPPFRGSTDKEIMEKVEQGTFSFDNLESENVSDSAKDLITKMLTMNPANRISAKECLQHVFLRAHLLDEFVDAPSLVNALDNMRQFRASQKLAEAALFFMGSKLTTWKETKKLTKIFQTLDVNGDGQLDRNELIKGYQYFLKEQNHENLSMEVIERSVDQIIESADFDKNGTIDYSEFVTVTIDKKTLLSLPRLRMAFNLFDLDGSGKIACDELCKILGDSNVKQWFDIMQEVDSNRDGEIDFEEFVTMMHQIFFF